jgi:hypothetical protein
VYDSAKGSYQCTIKQYARRNPRYSSTGTPGVNSVRNPTDLRCTDGMYKNGQPVSGLCPPAAPTPTSTSCDGAGTLWQNWSDGSQTVIEYNSSQCVSGGGGGGGSSPTPTTTSCSGSTLMQNWSDGTQTVIAYNSSQCTTSPTQTSTFCSGTTLMQNWSDGSQTVIAYNSSQCTASSPTQTTISCSGTTLMQNWSDGSQTVIATNSSQCGYVNPVTQTTTFCSGTTLMQNWSDGSTTVIAYNSTQCGYYQPQNGTSSLSGTYAGTYWADYSNGQPASWGGLTTSNIYANGCTIANTATNISQSWSMGGSAGADSTMTATWSCGGVSGSGVLDVCGGKQTSGGITYQCQ